MRVPRKVRFISNIRNLISILVRSKTSQAITCLTVRKILEFYTTIDFKIKERFYSAVVYHKLCYNILHKLRKYDIIRLLIVKRKKSGRQWRKKIGVAGP